MKRIVSAIALIAMTLSLICGCKNESDSKTPFAYNLDKYVTLGNYIGVEYTYEEAPVTDELVTSYINTMLSQKGYGEQKEFTEGTVKVGDTANIDFEGLRDGVAFEGGTAKGSDLVIGSGTFIDGFEDGLVGVSVGETVTLDLTFPDPYPNNPDLAGKPVQFIVKVNSIKTTVYPELTVDIVREISDLESTDEHIIDDYMAYVKEQVALFNKQNAIDEKESEIWSKIIEGTTIKSYPESEVEKYKEKTLKRMDEMVAQQYGAGLTYEDYLKQAEGLTLEDVDADLTAEAQRVVKEYMTVVAIARDQDLVPTEEEFQTEYKTYADKSGYSSVDELLKTMDEEQFRMSIIVNKVMDFVVENAVEVK